MLTYENKRFILFNLKRVVTRFVAQNFSDLCNKKCSNVLRIIIDFSKLLFDLFHTICKSQWTSTPHPPTNKAKNSHSCNILVHVYIYYLMPYCVIIGRKIYSWFIKIQLFNSHLINHQEQHEFRPRNNKPK